jgi:hypothetical protein
MLVPKGSQGEGSASKGTQREVPTQKGGQRATRPETTTTESDAPKGQSERTTDLSTGDEPAPQPPRPKPRYNPRRNSEDEDIGDGQYYSFVISADVERDKHDLYLSRR